MARRRRFLLSAIGALLLATVIVAPAAPLRAAGAAPFWIANYRVTPLWSGADGEAVPFGDLPQFSPLLALGQVGGRLLVLNPAGEGVAYVDASAAGPVGAPFPAVLLLARDGGARLVHVEVAATAAQQAYGLMGRTSLPPDSGMLFVWDQPQTVDFWMKDTPLPLSIAFIDAGGAVVSVQDMQPFSTDLHASPAPYQFALEASQGYFAAHHVDAGAAAVVTLPAGP